VSGASDPRESSGLITFGPFRLNMGERLLEQDGLPVSLGARALDILAVLAQRPGKVVEKKELMDLVWPGVNVDEGSLRFHMNGLRKALGDGREERATSRQFPVVDIASLLQFFCSTTVIALSSRREPQKCRRPFRRSSGE
jgi:DNA-binding response OmpR family regulator